MYPYEGMFLVDPVAHGADPEGVEKAVYGLLEKHGAKVRQFEKWDDRKLAFEIKGHRRGVYLLAHFEMPGDKVTPFRTECSLTETILRHLVMRLEDDITTHLEKVAKYSEKMREGQDERRGRRDDESPDDMDREDLMGLEE
jgi:small subunit ribosomal protein S6